MTLREAKQQTAWFNLELPKTELSHVLGGQTLSFSAIIQQDGIAGYWARQWEIKQHQSLKATNKDTKI